ncbi:MAG: hypothetical protein Q4A07_05990 [Coriobacteriales bacterium]|nr:hypothetical protein [Coriobacteriales bacterium]
MSLKDTIKGAREEAGSNVRPFDRAPKDASDDAVSAGSSNQQGFVRKSATKAKPSRRASEGVRMVSSSGKTKKKSDVSKEVAKAERKHDREISDLRYNVSQKLLEEREDYQRIHKIWFRFLVAGIALMATAVILYLIVSNMGTNAPEALGILGLLVMVAAYIVVIVGLIYDWRKIRPIRSEVDAYVKSMSEKRLITAINKAPKKAKK